MEIRARYVLVGLFSLAVILAGFGFVYWLNNVGGLAERASYRIRFDHSVSGLLLGSAVQFNGIRAGEVTDLRLNPEDPRQVEVMIAVLADAPVRTDTDVGLVFGGLTGVPEIALTGGTPDAPRPESSGGEPPLLVAAAGATLDWTETAREVFVRVEALISDNSDALGSTLENLGRFSEALARNSDQVDDLLAGLARLVGARTGGSASVTYDLTAPDIEVADMPEAQLIVTLPSAPLAYDTQRFLMQSDGGETAAFEGAMWSDSAPRLLQSAIVRSFENAGFLGVGNDLQALSADHVLLIDIRGFRLVTAPAMAAELDVTAKLLNGGQMIAARRFRASAPLEAEEAAAAARAFEGAFGVVASELVPWTLAAM